jgi:acyl carrier protein
MTTLTADARMHGGDGPPGELWDKVVRLLVEETDILFEPALIRPETSLRDELALSSLQALEAVMRLEDEYGMTIEDQELATLATVGDIVRLIAAKTSAGTGAPGAP